MFIFAVTGALQCTLAMQWYRVASSNFNICCQWKLAHYHCPLSAYNQSHSELNLIMGKYRLPALKVE